MNTVLLMTAAVLGFLAFFEPCTIATHTLFAVRLSRETVQRRGLALAELVLSRTLLLMAIFGIAGWVGLDEIPTAIAMTILGVIGAIYLISRRIYLPVPHIAFFRLLPCHARLQQEIKLGLTLPACTLPLVLVVGVISALNQRPDTALLAGFIFAAMFSLPTIWDSTHKFDAAHRAFLGKAANLSPYLTTLLLWSGALIILKTGV
jgi:cytochrome c-type biogenesis protein